jgi:hypothetical protein
MLLGQNSYNTTITAIISLSYNSNPSAMKKWPDKKDVLSTRGTNLVLFYFLRASDICSNNATSRARIKPSTFYTAGNCSTELKEVSTRLTSRGYLST